MRHRAPLFAFLALLVLSVAACGGIGGGYSPLPTPAASASVAPQSATVNFLVIVPSSGTTTAHRKPQFETTSNAQSVSFTLDSVNGTAPSSSTPTVVNLTSSTAGCEQTTAQLTCNVGINAPAGTLVFTVKTYTAANAGGTVIQEGNVSVTAAAGSSVNAPVTLGGTVAKLTLSISPAEQGGPQTIPVTLQALDASGNTIVGSYGGTIALTDTDASSQTTLSATSVSDSTAAAALTLNYAGGAMSAAATIAASMSGLSASATFLPDNLNPQSFNESVSVSYSYSYGTAGQSPTGSGGPYTYTNDFDYETGQTFNGVSNVISIETDEYEGYYLWTYGSASSSLGYLGDSDSGDDTYTCSAPYSSIFVVPVPSSWNVYSGAGPCLYTENENSGATDFETESTTTNANGSYSGTQNWNESGVPGCSCPTDYGTETASVDASGNSLYEDNSGQGSIWLSVPAPTGATMTVSYAVNPTGTFPPSASPSPATTTVPNPYTTIGLASPLPALQSDTFTVVSASATPPPACPVPTSVLPAGTTLTHVTEQFTYADPLNWNDDLYNAGTVDHYYLPGVGDVCNVWSYGYDYFDEGAAAYYSGTNTTIDYETYTEAYYVTASTLTAALKHRDVTMTNVWPTSVAIFNAAVRTVHAEHLAKLMKQKHALGRERAGLSSKQLNKASFPIR